MERFWSKVNKKEEDECWEWQAGRDNHGYGQVVKSYSIDRRTRKAHRVSWELTSGKIPDGMCVLHTCDNPPCVNPSHLFLGTQRDNVRDCEIKGRKTNPPIRNGEDNNHSRFTVEQVREIRERYSKGDVSQASLAREYGTSYNAIWCIVNRKTWRHI
jgi:hypothetical protein